ncbi:pyridoxamine 5'-phosphate oxidase family protein [Streptomyces sp. NBC_01451]|uniref:pyridoxamine 5'-phosphate oxidase family protein n=1 Tax=Streptomyces sp. NBC_01451 TaxID=2903872 RepID=UPI002E3172CB|nr:pyridoxamine 5'-phosphate oxidase family protein [Streptomyces sp. NBC_01451]
MPRPLADFSRARMTELGREDSLALLAGVPLGRVGLSHQALPVIRPASHLVDGGHIVIRTHTGSALLRDPAPAEVVVYEADQIDLEARTGWSVTVTSRARMVTDPLDVARYQQLLISWTTSPLTMSSRSRPRSSSATAWAPDHTPQHVLPPARAVRRGKDATTGVSQPVADSEAPSAASTTSADRATITVRTAIPRPADRSLADRFGRAAHPGHPGRHRSCASSISQ